MSELDGAVQTAAEPVAAPEAQAEQNDAPSIDRASEPTPRSAIDRAFEAVEKMEQPSGDRPRGPDGKFIAKDAANETQETVEAPDAPEEAPEESVDEENKDSPFSEPPSRFSADAKAAWKDAPEPVKAEIHRAVKELQAGIEKYREPASKWESLKPFHEFCAANETDIGTALQSYIAADQKLGQDLLGGLEEIVSHYGYSLRDVAAHVLGQPVDQTQQQASVRERALERELAEIKQSLGTVTQSIQSQQQNAVLSKVEAFAQAHPRFDELASEIGFFLQTKRAGTLEEAYELAERIKPAPQAPAVTTAPKTDPAAQTRKGSLSVTGAPSSGSNPANRKPPSSAREALDRAFAGTGLA